jgi:hypothetical protein
MSGLDEGEVFQHPFKSIVFNKTDFRDVMAYAASSLPEYVDYYNSDTLYTIAIEDRIANFGPSLELIKSEEIFNPSIKSITKLAELAEYLSTAAPKSAFVVESYSSSQKELYEELFSKLTDLVNLGLEFGDVELEDDDQFITFKIRTGGSSERFLMQCQEQYDPIVVQHINKVLGEISDYQICGFYIDELRCCFAYLPNKLVLKLEDLNLFQRGEAGLLQDGTGKLTQNF